MRGLNRLLWLIPLAVAYLSAVINIASSIVINLLTADKPLPIQDLFLQEERRWLWLALAVLTILVPISVWLNLKSDNDPQALQEERKKKFRQRLLEQVSDRVEEILRGQTLKSEIPLRWEECPDLVTAGLGEKEIRVTSRTLLPQETTMGKQFLNLRVGETLLILGDRGAGKSTTLYKLAQALLIAAQHDASAPVPVVLHLNAWERYCRDRRRRSSAATFQDWIVKTLDNSPYRILQECTQEWLNDGLLVLLLDGLDELSNTEWRNECVKTINQFKQGQRIIKIVVCSQMQIYEELSTRLDVEQALCIQPLEAEQIEDFLNQSSEDFAKVRAAYQAMQQQFRTPLDLSVIALACQELSLQELRSVVQGQEWYPRFWSEYVQRMFQQRRTISHYPREKVQKWLCWLAKGMQKVPQADVQSRFLIEELQPTWLNTRWQKVLYWLICKTLNYFKIFLLALCFLGQLFLGMMLMVGIAAKPSEISMSTLIAKPSIDPISKSIHDFITRV